MGHDSARDPFGRSSTDSPDSRQLNQFGWRPDQGETPARSNLGGETRSADDAQESDFTGPSILGDTPTARQAYWTPDAPGDLPPTIIRRKQPPAVSELLGRYGKPAAAAFTVAAVSTAGLLQSPQNVSAEASESDAGEGSGNTLPASPHQSAQPLYELASEIDAAQATTSEQRDAPIIYTVQPGDEVRKIAQSFGLQTMTVVWNNNLPNPDLIFPGQELLILPVDGVLVEVHPGDSLRGLATTYGTSIEAIINYEPNGITDPDLIQPGQQLIIPGGAPPTPVVDVVEPVSETVEVDQTTTEETGYTEPSTVAESTSIEVEPGDTLANIAQRFGVTIDEIAQANEISDIDLIVPGDLLAIPGEHVVETEPVEEEVPVVEPDPEPQVEVQVTPEPEPEPEQVQEPDPPVEPDPPAEPEPTATPVPPEPTPTPIPEPTATPAPDSDPDPEPQQSGVPGDIPGLLEYYADQYGLDPNLVKAVAWRESGWNQSAVSSSGAQGVMQIMPSTGTFINNNLVSQNLDVSGSAADNIHAGTAYLAYRINQFGSVEQGLAAYFLGANRVVNGIPAAGQNYVDRIFEIRDYIATHGEPPSWR